MIIKINYPDKHSRVLVVLLNPRTDVTAISLGLWGKKKYGVAFRIKVQTHISWDFDHSRIRKCRDMAGTVFSASPIIYLFQLVF